MFRRLIIAIGLLMVVLPPVAESAGGEECRRGLSPGEVGCGGRNEDPGRRPSGRRTRLAPGTTIRRAFLRTLPDGTECYYFGFGSSVPEGTPYETVEDLDAYVDAPPCPPADPVDAVVQEFWETVVLPRPQPDIRPGKAIAGKDAYLEIAGERRRTFTIANPLGGPPIVIEATGSYTIDWGDGSSTMTFSQGGPWPDGDLTHVWTAAGRYDVVVTESWTATWSAGPAAGSLDGLQTIGRLDDFPVIEVQAVRNR